MTEENLLHLIWLSLSIGVDWSKARTLKDILDRSISLNIRTRTPLNFNSFLELKAISGFR